MRYLNADTILHVLALEDVMGAVEEALRIYEGGDFEMPERLSADCGNRDLLLLMPCVAGDSVVTKLLTLYPDNPKSGRPMIDGLVVLADRGTGELLAIMDAKAITAMRTGAVTGVSIQRLARRDAHVVGLVGCGTQGFYQLRYACAARDIRQVYLYDVSPQAAASMVERLSAVLPDVQIAVADSTAALARNADIIITATTAKSPVFPNDPELFKGKHCVAIGSFQPDVREYPDALWQVVERVWVDLMYAMEESGELMIPLEQGLLAEERIETLGHFILSGREPERGLYGTTFFKTVGMALFDLTTARLAYERAAASGRGVLLS